MQGRTEVENLTVVQVMLRYLELEEATDVFGIPGGALMNILDELKAQDDTFTYHVCRQETGAAYIAHGYARVSGKLGVVIVTSGPGATNALTGSMNAHAAHVPLLTITGEVSQEYFGRGYLQEGIDSALDVAGVYRNAVGWSEIISSQTDFETLFAAALRAAFHSRRQAVHVSIPNNIAVENTGKISLPETTKNYRADSPFVDRAGVRAAIAAIAVARRPMLMLGNGCRRPLQNDALRTAFTEAVEALSVPVMTSPDAKGIFPESHPWSLRNYGMAGCEWPRYYLHPPDGEQYDCLVVIGSDLGELATNKWDPLLIPTDTFIQMHNSQQVLARAFPITQGVVGDVGALLEEFVDAADGVTVPNALSADRKAAVDHIKKTYSPFADPALRESDETPIAPPALIAAINSELPDKSHVFVDAGNCVGWCLNYFEIDPPRQIHSALAMGPMGFGVGAVIGGKIADPDAVCLAVVGDGAFMMQVAEIATAAQAKAGAIWVVLADHDLSMVSQGMAHFEKDPSFLDYYKLDWKDLGEVARGFGAETYEVSSPADATAHLKTAIERSSGGIPQVLVVTIDHTLVPPYYPPPYVPGDPASPSES
jgi:acetolactate synthase-1/2/3 large subunit